MKKGAFKLLSRNAFINYWVEPFGGETRIKFSRSFGSAYNNIHTNWLFAFFLGGSTTNLSLFFMLYNIHIGVSRIRHKSQNSICLFIFNRVRQKNKLYSLVASKLLYLLHCKVAVTICIMHQHNRNVIKLAFLSKWLYSVIVLHKNIYTNRFEMLLDNLWLLVFHLLCEFCEWYYFEIVCDCNFEILNFEQNFCNLFVCNFVATCKSCNQRGYNHYVATKLTLYIPTYLPSFWIELKLITRKWVKYLSKHYVLSLFTKEYNPLPIL